MSTATVTGVRPSDPGRSVAGSRERSFRPAHRLPALDGLRGFAIVAVMIYHFADQCHSPELSALDQGFVRICMAGWVGVDLFFVLSGFLITGILHDTKDTREYLPSFFGRRFLRIVPLYYAALLVMFLALPKLAGHVPSQFQATMDNQWWFWTYTANWLYAIEGTFSRIPCGYLWSLAVEEQFYLVWPFVVLLHNRRQLLRTTVVLLAVTVTLRSAMLAMGSAPTTVYVLPLTHVDGLLAGALVALLTRARPGDVMRRSTLASLGIGSFVALIVLGSLRGNLYFWDHWVAAVGFALIAVLCTCLLALALTADRNHWARWIFSNRVARSFGTYSYAIYIFHVPVGVALRDGVFSPPEHLVGGSVILPLLAFFALASLVCWALAFLSWNLFEKHFLGLKRFFPYMRGASV